MQLGFLQYNDIPKLRGCYLAYKEDPCVIPNLVLKMEEEVEEEIEVERCHILLYMDYAGFAFASSNLMKTYIEEKIKHHDAATQNK